MIIFLHPGDLGIGYLIVFFLVGVAILVGGVICFALLVGWLSKMLTKRHENAVSDFKAKDD